MGRISTKVADITQQVRLMRRIQNISLMLSDMMDILAERTLPFLPAVSSGVYCHHLGSYGGHATGGPALRLISMSGLIRVTWKKWSMPSTQIRSATVAEEWDISRVNVQLRAAPLVQHSSGPANRATRDKRRMRITARRNGTAVDVLVPVAVMAQARREADSWLQTILRRETRKTTEKKDTVST